MATTYKSYWEPADGLADASAAVSLEGQTVKLSEGESRHLVKVFRARPGDAVTLFDAAGNIWHSVLADTGGRAAQLRIERHERIAPPHPRITLGQALPKGKTMDSVIAAMVELGVAVIAPLATDHSEVRIEKDAARAESKREHWQQTAIEAAKQSSNFYGTRIEPIASLKEFLKTLPPLHSTGESAASAVAAKEAAAVPVAAAEQGAVVGVAAAERGAVAPATSVKEDAAGQSAVVAVAAEKDAAMPVAAAKEAAPEKGAVVRSGCAVASQLRIIGSLEEGSVPLAALAPQIASAAEVVCLIGPEGDFSATEYALAHEHGFKPVRLAAHVLRVKTAATYIVSTVDALARAARSGQ